MILAGDIGGTNSRLAFFDVADGQLKIVTESIYPSKEARGLDEIVVKFVKAAGHNADIATFGIAGPVRNGRVETSNLPWVVESKRLAAELKTENVWVINDLEANAWGIPMLGEKDVVTLNRVKGTPVGNQAVIAAGTGLGEAGMFWDGTQYRIFATEGGHADFAARDELEIDLLRYLHTHFGGHVSYERIVSGPGLVNVYQFLKDTGRGEEPAWLRDEITHGVAAAAAISSAAMGGRVPMAEQALDIWVSIYGAEAETSPSRSWRWEACISAEGLRPRSFRNSLALSSCRPSLPRGACSLSWKQFPFASSPTTRPHFSGPAAMRL